MREKANEQSKLGEQALRRLVHAEGEAAARKKRQQEEHEKKKTLSLREQGRRMFLETIASVAGDQDGAGNRMEVDGEVKIPSGMETFSSAVNSEKRYWRKPARS